MNKVKIYEIKSGAAVNAPGLLSPDGKYFYWDNAQFASNNPGDKVFVINPTHKWALFTEIKRMDIAATFNAAAKKSSFNHEYNSYTVEDPDGRFKVFIRFDIIQKVTIPANWNWITILGSSQIYDLWRDDIVLENIPRRKEKVHDLMKLFTEGEAFQTLNETLELLSGPLALNPEIVEAVEAEKLKAVYNDDQFYFLKAQEKLTEFNNLVEAYPGFYEESLKKFIDSGLKFTEFFSTLVAGEPVYALFRTIGELVSYCDLNAARKNEFNEYADKRTVARAGIHQNDWVRILLKYKIEKNNPQILSSSIYNALQYVKDPVNGLTMLSEKHRALVSKYLLKQPAYNKETIIPDLVAFFNPYNIAPVNPLNHTRIITNVLYYYEKVRKIWFERIEGLAASDNTTWFNDAINDCKSTGKIVLWWSTVPSKRANVDRLLPATLNDRGFIYLYYFQKNNAVYRARVKDYAYAENYASKNWNIKGDVAWFRADFNEYKESDTKFAKIVFLADEFIKLQNPIPVDKFEFYAEVQPPRHDNLQPYSEIDWEDEVIESDTESVPIPVTIPEPKPKTYMPTISSIPFDHEDRNILTAIKTKPFILLAGLSGTGKSRLVRKLAYHTCTLPELQGDKPGNFLLIPVRPNWHDSMEILGYVSRISGRPEYIITPFIRFLAKAWQYPEIPFFICLDEMNLAPVEQYFAEFLSLVETRQVKDGGDIITDSLLSYADFKEKELFDQLLNELEIAKGSSLRDQFETKGITLPRNLIVMGTVNMDETTHSFSRKVLDRAMTFEINNVDLKSGLDQVDHAWKYPDTYIGNKLLFSDFTHGGQVYPYFPEADNVIDFLEKLNAFLESTVFKIAYRVRDEFLIYCYHNSQMQDKPEKWLLQCLDELTLMKVLSRIEGDHSKVGKVLDALIVYLDVRSYPRSAAKLAEMKEKLEFGYTTYW